MEQSLRLVAATDSKSSTGMMYKRFTGRMKLGVILHANPALLPVAQRFDIRFGVGEKTIAEICRERGIVESFFIEILNVYNDESYFPEAALRKSDMRLIVEYLRKTHTHYLAQQLPGIAALIAALVRSGGDGNRSLRPVAGLFEEFQREFKKHIEHEEAVTFPHALAVAERFRALPGAPAAGTGHATPRRTGDTEHVLMDEKLYDLKNLLIKYIDEPYDAHACSALIFELDRLERDIRDHARIEDRILLAMVARMGTSLHKATRA